MALAAEPTRGRISVYAQGRDYHDVVKSALKSLARWMVEAEGMGACQGLRRYRAGDGKAARPAAGSAGRASTPTSSAASHGSGCSSARSTRLDSRLTRQPATDAAVLLGLPDRLPDRRLPRAVPARCAPLHLLPDHRTQGPDPGEFREGIGNRIYGCDDCLAVCPWNKFAQAAQRTRRSSPRAELAAPRSPTCSRSMSRPSGRYFPARRSSASAACGWFATPPSRQATAVTRLS
jgi:epoxyqueuosine reductase